MSINLAGNRTRRFPSVGFEGCKVITSRSSELLEFRSQNSLAPFRPSEGFQGPGHMDPLTSLGAAHSTLSRDLVRVMDMSPRSHRRRV
jgi:hypothetical protein